MPRRVMVDDQALPMVPAASSAVGWHYDPATATVAIRTSSLPTDRPVTISQAGGHAVTRPEPASVALTIDPPAPLSLTAGSSTTVKATVSNDGPGSITGVAVKLTAPPDWTAVPVAPAPGTLGRGQSATVSWTVTAPSGSTGTVTAALQATASYTSQATGTPGSVTAAEQPAPPAPPPAPPSITSVTPASGAAGTVETITGSGFGSSQGSNYLTLADQGTSWGAPYDAASLQISSWSDTKIVFTLPAPSGTNGIWHLVPGTTATVTVTTPAGTSGTGNISITGSP
jgi:hypothetical protein